MRERLKLKLKSTVGASLSLALLVFLICAAVGAVVLAAGTAAAGTASQRAEMDRRYYNVLSAAELVRDTLNNQTYQIVRTEKITSSRSAQITLNAETGEPKVGAFSSSVPAGTEYGVSSSWTAGGTASFLSTATCNYVLGTTSLPDTSDARETAWSVIPGHTATLSPFTLTLSLEGSDPVTVTPTLLSDGSLRFVLESGGFKVELNMNAAFSDNSSAPATVSTTETVTTSEAVTENTTTTKTKTSTLKWTAGTMRVIGA